MTLRELKSGDLFYFEGDNHAKQPLEYCCSPTQSSSTPKPPKKLPDVGKIEYMGFKLSKFQGTNVGYGGVTHKIDSKGRPISGIFDSSKHSLRESTRKVSGVETEYPDGGSKVHSSLKAAIKYIHQWHGVEDTVRSVKNRFQFTRQPIPDCYLTKIDKASESLAALGLCSQ